MFYYLLILPMESKKSIMTNSFLRKDGNKFCFESNCSHHLCAIFNIKSEIVIFYFSDIASVTSIKERI